MSWETRDVRGAQPKPRYWHTAELLEGKLFVIGGFDGSKSLNDVRVRVRDGGVATPTPHPHPHPHPHPGQVSVLDMETLLWSSPKCSGEPMLALAQHTAVTVGPTLAPTLTLTLTPTLTLTLTLTSTLSLSLGPSLNLALTLTLTLSLTLAQPQTLALISP